MVRAFLQRHAQRLLAILVIAGAYLLAGQPQPTAELRSSLGARFAFDAAELPPAPGKTALTAYQVPIHPQVAHLRGQIAATGAAIALGDLDGDGLPNDACLVDPRTDSAMITPLPGRLQAYAPILLEPPGRPRGQPVDYPKGCILADLNEDGREDAVVYYGTRPPVAFLRHGDTYLAQELVPGSDAVWYTGAGIVADLDGDGHLDLMFANYYPDGARMHDPGDVRSVRMADSLGHATNGGRTHFLLFEHASRGDRPGVRFRHVSNVLPDEIDRGWTLALGAIDLDGDQLPEVYMANDFGPDRLLHNLSRPGALKFAALTGRRTFTMPKSKILGRDSFKGMGLDFGDLDGNGHLDIAVSNITSAFAFVESNFVFLNTGRRETMADGHAPFNDASERLGLARSGWSWDVRFGDFDNDGSLEIVQATGYVKGRVDQWPEMQESGMANDAIVKYPAAWLLHDNRHDVAGREPNRFWVRGETGRYVDIGDRIGFTREPVSRGVATADVDGDGDLDFAVTNQWQPSRFYRNRCPACGRFVGLHLRLPLAPMPQGSVRDGHPGADVPSRSAIGAAVRLTASDGRSWLSFVDGGSGHAGKRAPSVHFGVGRIDPGVSFDLHVRYRDPSGHVREFRTAIRPGWQTVLLPWTRL